MAEAFQTYFKNLYDTPEEAPSTVEGIFKDLNLVKLSEAEAEELTALILESEIEGIIRSLKNNKSPGTDGLPGEF